MSFPCRIEPVDYDGQDYGPVNTVLIARALVERRTNWAIRCLAISLIEKILTEQGECE